MSIFTSPEYYTKNQAMYYILCLQLTHCLFLVPSDYVRYVWESVMACL